MKLKQRSKEPELMDNEGTEEEIIDALSELKLINKLLGGNSVTESSINKVRKKFNLSFISLLDVGSGASDIFNGSGVKGILKITSLDKNKFICSIVKKRGTAENVACGDALSFPFKAMTFDIVHSSLFLHHFDDDVICVLLKSMTSLAKYAVVINDLQRSYISYYGFILLSLLFSGSRLVKYDGPLSIKRGFRRGEIIDILNRTGLSYELKSRWAFRWGIIIYCK